MGVLKCIFRLMTLFGFGLRQRSICSAGAASLSAFFFTLLFSAAAFASYSWSGQAGTYSSAVDYCTAAYAASGVKVTGVGARISGTYASCTGTASRSDGTTYDAEPVYGYGANRSGTGCDTGSTYNSTTGACDAPTNKCAILKDTPIASFRYASASDTPPAKISINGCEATTGGVTLCKNSTKGNYVCTGTATLTGNELAATDTATSGECSGATCTTGQPVPETSTTPCNMVNGQCTSTSSESNPGTTSCSSSGSSYSCTEKPLSTSTDKVNDIVQTTDTSTTGTITTTITTTTTTTGCKGVGGCSTSVTVSKSSTGTNSDGTSTGTTTTCSGSGCSGSGGSGTGSGSDDDDDDQDEDTVSGDMVCTAVVSCSGDVIQCAILRQEQQSRCADLDFRDLSDKKVADAKASLDTEFAGADYQKITADADHTFNVSDMLDTSTFFGSSCPKLPTINGTYGQFAVSIDFNLDSFCTFLTILGYINLAFALKKAAEIIGKGAQ